MCFQSEVLEILPRTSRYGTALIYIISGKKERKMFPRWHDSERGITHVLQETRNERNQENGND
jgi:hypothetical protein